MKIAYLHVLPLEYYPPARNILILMSRRSAWQVRAWTSRNRRDLPAWNRGDMEISRPWNAGLRSLLPFRIAGYIAWHFRAAVQIAAWKPDALIAVEPHSALAAWLYYRIFRGKAALFIHHHEYYSPEDFSAPGMRVLQRTRVLERRDLFPRAGWISQTNPERMRLLRAGNPVISEKVARILPNFPPAQWVRKALAIPQSPASERLRLVYLGSASLEDTFIEEVARWVEARPDRLSLHVVGNNVSNDVWKRLHSMDAPNITTDEEGCDYEALPELLTQFDVGLILYKGNTLNFVHNVPNKAIEYLACGLEVWYPREMEGMRAFHDQFPGEPLREMDFRGLTDIPSQAGGGERSGDFPFTCEAATKELFRELARLAVAAER